MYVLTWLYRFGSSRRINKTFTSAKELGEFKSQLLEWQKARFTKLDADDLDDYDEEKILLVDDLQDVVFSRRFYKVLRNPENFHAAVSLVVTAQPLPSEILPNTEI